LTTARTGSRHIETFERKKDADAREAQVTVDVAKGIHTAPSKSITVAEAAQDWIKYIEGEGRERTTVHRYREIVRLHIIPRLGNEKLAKLTTPRINKFRDEVLESMSRPMAKKVLVALKATIKDAKRRGMSRRMLHPMFRLRHTVGTSPSLRLGATFRRGMRFSASLMPPSPARGARCC
jgi:hypothetical protein